MTGKKAVASTATARVVALPNHSAYLCGRAAFVADQIQKVINATGYQRDIFVPTWKGTWTEFSDITSSDDLYGGLAAHLLYFDKTNLHPLVPDAAVVPKAWIPGVAECVGDAAFTGFACFSRVDLLDAGERLFKAGISSLRLKPVLIDGGLGQKVAHSLDELHRHVESFSDAYVNAGISLEENLSSVLRTIDVGTYKIADMVISYVGYQKETLFHGDPGRWGGVDFYARRGSLADLASWLTAPRLKQAVLQAQALDDTLPLLPNTRITRRNYDVLQGFDDAGNFRSALLEPSWRIGGSSPAEALTAVQFLDDSIELVHGIVDETFSDQPFNTQHLENGSFTTGSYLWDDKQTYWLMRASAEATSANVPFLRDE